MMQSPPLPLPLYTSALQTFASDYPAVGVGPWISRRVPPTPPHSLPNRGLGGIPEPYMGSWGARACLGEPQGAGTASPTVPGSPWQSLASSPSPSPAPKSPDSANHGAGGCPKTSHHQSPALHSLLTTSSCWSRALQHRLGPATPERSEPSPSPGVILLYPPKKRGPRTLCFLEGLS